MKAFLGVVLTAAAFRPAAAVERLAETPAALGIRTIEAPSVLAGPNLAVETIEGLSILPQAAPAELPAIPALPAPVQAQAAVFLDAARKGGSPETAELVRDMPRHFDGLAPEARADVLAGLETLAKANPKEPVYRRTLQNLIARDELEQIEPRLRRAALTAARREDVLAKTYYKDVNWWSRFDSQVDPDGTGVPYGRCFPDGRIALFVEKNWGKMPSFAAHFRVLFSHEYTHRLQNEKEVTTKYGGEIPAVATELLRAVELVGLHGMTGGMISFIGEGVLSAFDWGVQWARAPLTERPAGADGFYRKGFLAGAAYEIAQQTGRWADAWEFHRLVSSGVPPGEAEARVKAGPR